MKIGILALTAGGRDLALQVASKYNQKGRQADVYLPEHMREELQPPIFFYKERLRELVPSLFSQYRGLVFIMAAGIVVRLIGPLAKDKKTDPAVIVMDEKGQFIVPILSGHLGGANSLAGELAPLLGATAVITTATDVLGKTAPDELARKYNLVIEPWENLVKINSLLANDAKVDWFVDEDIKEAQFIKEIEPISLAKYHWDGASDGTVLITNRLLPVPKQPYLFLRPKNLIMGVGCRKGIASGEIISAIYQTLAQGQRSAKSLLKLTSVDVKKAEPGLQQAAEYFQVPIEFYDRANIEEAFKKWPQLNKSTFVQKQIGVDGVCEPTALMGGRETSLLVPKQKFPGITTALVEDVYRL